MKISEIINYKINKIINLCKQILNTGQKKRLALLSFLFVFILFFNISAPKDFPSGTLIKIQEGESLNEIAFDLKEQSVIKSEFLFKVFLTIMAGQSGALSGDYFFEEKQSVIKIAKRISQGMYGLTPLKIRFMEGSTVKDMSLLLSEKFSDFNTEEFLNIAQGKEGFLFPDTYLFLPNVSPAQVVREMENVFQKRISGLADKIEKSGKTLEEIIIMASILEKEAITLEDKKIVSGILWKRMDIGMPLQVDAPFIYERNKNTFELTTKDLRKDSPYNTYTNKGLTPTPIANPGLDSIIAAIEPTESLYLFYLSDIRGNIYYAENYNKHLYYKRKYID